METSYPTSLGGLLPAELQPITQDLEQLLRDIVEGLRGESLQARFIAQPVLGVGLLAILGQSIALPGLQLRLDRVPGLISQTISVSGGYVGEVNAVKIEFHLPPVPRTISPEAAQELLEAMPLLQVPPVAPLPENHNLELSPNPLFVGRDSSFQQIASLLKEPRSQVPIVVISGIIGVGKTNLASEFAHRYGRFFGGGVFWLNCADPSRIQVEVAGCALSLGFKEISNLPLADQVKRVTQEWGSNLPRLLILDNCEDEAVLRQLRPASGGCRLLVTSRRVHWSPDLEAEVLRLGVFDRSESIALLCRYRPDLSTEVATLGKISASLGDLPLALHIAGSYLHMYQTTPYLSDPKDLYEAIAPDLINSEKVQSPTGGDTNITRILSFVYDRLGEIQGGDDTRRLLALLACLSPGNPVPNTFTADLLGVNSTDKHALIKRVEPAVQQAIDIGMLSRLTTGAVVLHRLVAGFLARHVNDPTLGQQVQDALMRTAARENELENNLLLRELDPHLKAVIDQATSAPVVAALCYERARYLVLMNLYADALPEAKRSLAIYEELYGQHHIQTARSLHSVCAAQLKLPNPNLSMLEAHLRQVVALLESTPDEHPRDLATALSNLGVVLGNQQRRDEERSIYWQGLDFCKQYPAATARIKGRILHNLGVSFHLEKGYAEARRFYEQALDQLKQTGRELNPYTGHVMKDYAELLYDVADYELALRLYQQALTMDTALYGKEHSETAYTVRFLTRTLLAQAKAYADQARHIHSVLGGPESSEGVIYAEIIDNLQAQIDHLDAIE